MSERAMSSGFRALLGRLRAFKVDKFSRSGVGFGDPDGEHLVHTLDEANVVSSLLKERGDVTAYISDRFDEEVIDSYDQHIIVLDVDHLAYLIPSSTPGHSHLYVEIPPVRWEVYARFLEAAAAVGLVSQGYAASSISRGHSDVRLPWVQKEEGEA